MYVYFFDMLLTSNILIQKYFPKKKKASKHSIYSNLALTSVDFSMTGPRDSQPPRHLRPVGGPHD